MGEKKKQGEAKRSPGVFMRATKHADRCRADHILECDGRRIGINLVHSGDGQQIPGVSIVPERLHPPPHRTSTVEVAIYLLPRGCYMPYVLPHILHTEY